MSKIGVDLEGAMNFSVMLFQLGDGMLKTIGIFCLTLLFSLPLGFIVCFGRMAKKGWTGKVIGILCRVYISILRGTPLMLQLMVVYFGPYFLFGMSIGSNWRFPAIIIGFSLNYAAYFAEIYRSGIESMPIGQYEAAKLLGYNKIQTFFKIILPQVIKRILPAVTNEVITLVKDTSLAYALAYAEMFTIAKQIVASKSDFTPFIIAAVFYYIFNLVVAMAMEFIEKKLSYYQ